MPIPGYSQHDKKTIETTGQNRKIMAAARKGKFEKAKLKFEFAFLDMAATCQYQCKGCFNKELNASGASLDLSEMLDVVDFLKKRGGRLLAIAGSGEPLLDPLLLHIIGYAYKNDMRTVLFSTLTQTDMGVAVPIKDEVVDQLNKFKAWIIAKRNSLDNERQAELLGVPRSDAGMQMMNGLEKVKEAGFATYRRLLMDSPIDRHTIDEIPSLLRFCRERNILPYFESYIVHGQNKKTQRDHMITPDELRRLFLQMQEVDMEFGIGTELRQNMRIYRADACMKPEYGFAVKPNGEVRTCPTNKKTRIGNIRESSLEEILSPENKTYRRLFGKYACSVQFKGR